MTRAISDADRNAIVDILTTHAANPLESDTPQVFFGKLILSSNLPHPWMASIAGKWTGDAEWNALRLVEWAILKKVNPQDQRLTTIGAILYALLRQELPPDEARTVVAIMVGYGLILDDKLLDDIRLRYRVPVVPSTRAAIGIDYGPDFEWRGPQSELELQGFFSPPIPWQDVGFLRRAIERASSVCRIEIGERRGTGFLVAPTLVLTNYHVLKLFVEDDIEVNARNILLRFGCFTSSKGDASEGQAFKLAPDGIVAQSRVEELDFVLLKVESGIMSVDAIQPAPLDPSLPARKSALNILHHPGGDTMKLSTSGNGITDVLEDRGYVQYATPAVEGSSGSPCFNDTWKVVALHHAQRSRTWGSIREGILMHSIQKRIGPYLQQA